MYENVSFERIASDNGLSLRDLERLIYQLWTEVDDDNTLTLEELHGAIVDDIQG